MCSPSTENKQVASLPGAVLGRLKIRRSRAITSPTAVSCRNCSGTYYRATMVSRNISSTGNKPLRCSVRSWKNHIKNYYVDS